MNIEGRAVSRLNTTVEIVSYATVNDFGPPNTLPITFVVDGNGILRAEFTPDQTPVTEKTLSDAVLPLLPQNPATNAAANPAKP